jgi:hypothetical protein
LKLLQERKTPDGKSLLRAFQDEQRSKSVVTYTQVPENHSGVTQESESYNRNRNTKTERHGLKFDSKWEADCWDELLLLQKARIIFNLRRQKIFRFIKNGIEITHYRSDFTFDFIDRIFDEKSIPDVIADAKNPHNKGFQRWGMIVRCTRAWYQKEILVFLNKDFRDKDSVATDVKLAVYNLKEMK